MMNKRRNRRKFGIALTGLAAAGMFAATIPALQVSASDETTSLVDLPLIEISMQDTNPMSTLKKEIIFERASTDDSISLDNIDIERSTLDVTGFDRTSTGIQTVTAKVSLVTADDTNKSIGYSFTQDATVKMIKSSAPQLKLKSKNITVNNGDAWNASSYIAYINDDSGILPTLKVSGSPNMSEDGNYVVTYTVVDLEGNKYPIVEYRVCGDDPTVVEMIPGYTHNIINVSQDHDLVTVMWANEVFNPDRPDTFFEEV